MTTRRRRALLLVPLSALIGIWPVSPAGAQDTSVTMTLQAQTQYTTPERPVLRIAVAATNTGGTTIGDLSMGIAVGPSIVSRLGYGSSLITGPTSIASSVRVPLRGTLEPGGARTFTGEVDVTSLPTISTDDSKVYPLLITLGGDGQQLARLTSAQIHIVETPEAPVVLSWWLGVTAGPAFGPDGTFRNQALAASLGPGGSLAARVDALGRVVGRGAVIDVVVQPSLVADVASMAEGYLLPDGTQIDAGAAVPRAAAEFLEDLRAAVAAPGVEVVTLPMFAPSAPGMLAAGLGFDLRTQEQLGNRTVRELLGVEPAEHLERPVGGRLDGAALDRYVTAGVTTLLGETDTVARPPGPNGFAPAPTAVLAGEDDDPLTVVLPDPGTAALMTSTDLLADPVRASQVILGELAVVWKESPKPAPPVVRGLALELPGDLPPTVWDPLMDRITSAPFLREAHAANLVELVVPTGPRATLSAPDTTSFSDAYVQRIRSLERDVAAYRSMLMDQTAETPDQLGDALLQAEAATFMGPGEPLGEPWLDEVARITGAAFDGATPSVQRSFTLTSDEGTLPLKMGDPGEVPLRIIVRLTSSHFRFPEGNEREVILTEPGQVIEFAIEATSAGRNPLTVSVESPDGRGISEQTIVVRSTTLNTIALAITLAAAVGLVLLYARRWIRRTAKT